MTKYIEMNERQKKAYKNIKYAALDIIGGLENTMEDNEEGSEAYIRAENTLKDHEGLVHLIYCEATSNYYEPGFCGFSSAYQNYLKDIRFCGKEWLMEQVNERVRREGY